MLPSQTSQFTQAEYWNDFFVARKKAAGKGKSSAFEWYGDFKDDLLSLVKDLHEPSSTSLVLGCGNSTLSEDLVKCECASKVVSVDFSEKAIQEMQAKTKNESRLIWLLADVTSLPSDFESKFDSIWDKGALDALLGEVDGDESSLASGRKMLVETMRCLRPGGHYFCVSLLQDHVLRTLLDCFQSRPEEWETFTIIPFNPKSDSVLCPFLLVLKKALSPVSQQQMLLAKPHSKPQVMSNRKTLEQVVHEVQIAYGAKRALQQVKQGLRGTFSIVSPTNPSQERFRLQIIDTEKRKIPFAALILPQGREHEWSFSNEEGQMQVARSNEIGRLIFVSLGRNETFTEGVEGVQRELSSSILDFAPGDLPKTFKIPYLAVAQDLGERKIVASGESEVSGRFTVEDVTVGEETNRRLIFLNNPLAIQSECRISENKMVDLDHLSFEFHRAMSALGLAMLANENSSTEIAGIVCGVGGGGLLTYLSRRFPSSIFEGVEIDPSVVEVAKKYFSMPDSEKIKIHTADAYEFMMIREQSNDMDVVFIDINGGTSKEEIDQTSLRFPPKQFLEVAFLEHVRDFVLKSENGRVVLNFGCRSDSMTRTLLQQIKGVFNSVIALDMSEISGDLNIILCCSRGLKLNDTATLAALIKACEKEEMLEGLRILRDDGTLVELAAAPDMKANDRSKKGKGKKKKKKN